MYSIYLDKIKIGFTKLENSDPSMGVVFGKMEIFEDNFDYNFIKNYCNKNNIELTFDDSREKIIGTQNIAELKVFNESNIEINGKDGCNIEGMDSEGLKLQF